MTMEFDAESAGSAFVFNAEAEAEQQRRELEFAERERAAGVGLGGVVIAITAPVPGSRAWVEHEMLRRAAEKFEAERAEMRSRPPLPDLAALLAEADE